MTYLPDDGLVSPSDIADIADVSRAAVSNWRKRSDDFPRPIAGTSSKPLFSIQEVSAWLRSHGYKIEQDDGETAVWSAMNLLRGTISVDAVAELLLSLAVARKRGTRPPTFTGVSPATLELVEDAVATADLSALGPTVDFALERLARAQGKMGAEVGFIGSRTSTMLANIAARRPGGLLYDPACGIAAALIEAVDKGGRPEQVVGHDVNVAALRVAAQRAELHDVSIELTATDVMAEDIAPGLLAHTVILEPPFGLRLDRSGRWLMDDRFVFGPPPRVSADTAWLQHAIAHLTGAGRAYVLSPVGTLFRSGEEGKIRAELVRRGCVEAIVGLPGKLLPHTSIPLALWVLRRPDAHALTESILFIDATETNSPETQVHEWLTDTEQRRAVPHISVPITDVLAADSVLNPQRWVNRTERDPADVIAAYEAGWAQIHDSMDQVKNALASFQRRESNSHSRVMTVGELANQGVLEVRAGRPRDRHDNAPAHIRERIITAADVREGRLESAALDNPDDDDPEMTRKGDVLVTTMNTIRARVDDVGGHLPSTGVTRVRVRDSSVLDPEYLATVLTGSWNDRFQGGSTIQRAHVRDLEVPLLAIDEQRGLQIGLSTLRELHKHATQLARGASTVASALSDSVRYGVPLVERAVPREGPVEPGEGA